MKLDTLIDAACERAKAKYRPRAISPEVADRLVKKADEWMVSNCLPESMRFIIERAMFFGAGVKNAGDIN